MYLFSMRKLLKRLVKWGTIGVVAVVAGGLLIHLPLNWMAKRAAAAQLESLRARGLPVTPKEMEARFATEADRPNIAEVILRLEKKITDFPDEVFTEDDYKLVPIIGEFCYESGAPLSDETLASMRKVLDYVAPALDELTPLLDRNPVANAAYWDDPIAWLDIDLYVPLRQYVRLLSLRTLLESSEGNETEAGIWLNRCHAVGFSLRSHPTFIDASVARASEGMAHGALEDLLNRHGLPEELIQQLQLSLAHAANTQLLADSLLGEMNTLQHQMNLFRLDWDASRAYASAVFDYGFWTPALHVIAGIPMSLWMNFGGGIYRDQIVVFDFVSRYHQASQAGWPETTNLWNQVVADAEQSSRRYRLLVGDTLGLYEMVERGALLHSTRSALAATACGVELYIAEHGAPPESLDALNESHLPAGLNDPHTGRPFLYERLLDGYTLRSEHARECGETGETEDETCRNACSLSDLILTVQRPGLGLESL